MSGEGDASASARARAALFELLQEYDRANRLAIDAVYAQFSPTLDDFYHEGLRLEFPARPDAQGEVCPEIVLTRTVPGAEPKSVRGAGAPFPLPRAAALVAVALGEAAVSLRPRQVGGSQAVALYRESDGRAVADLLPGTRPGA